MKKEFMKSSKKRDKGIFTVMGGEIRDDNLYRFRE